MVTKSLVAQIIETRYEDISENARYEAKRSLLNWLGVAIGATNHESMDKLFAVAKLMGSRPQATVFGREEKTDLLFASLLNGMSSHVYDFDDTLLETVLHPSAPVFPAILAVAENKGKSGKDVLEAFVIGCEVEARLALAVYPSHYWRGWHITGSVGGIGAAAAVSKLLDLDHEKTSYAIGIAATEPVGLREMFGTMTKPFHPGKAAMNGLLAALMAEQGFTSSLQSLEAECGFVNVLSEENKLGILTEKWNEKWEVEKNSYKPFASGIVTHPAIDAIISLQSKFKFQHDQVASIHIKGHPLVKELTGKQALTTGLEGKFSVYHCVAAAFMYGKAGVDQFTDECVNDETIKSLREKITLEVDEKIKEDQVELVIKLADGREFAEFVEQAIGSVDKPMTNDQLIDKFLDVTGDIISFDAKRELVDLIYKLEELEDLTPFFELCQPVKSLNKR
jgi:2-methylcitrate dehydratase PrpD